MPTASDDPRPSWRRSGLTAAILRSLRLGGGRQRHAGGRRPARHLRSPRGRGGWPCAAADRRPRHVPVCGRGGHRPLCPHRRQGRRRGRPGGGARALRGRPRRRFPTSSPCAATPPTACPAPRASARRPPPSCCAATARWRRSSQCGGEPRPKLRAALLDARQELLAFKDIATLRDAGVERPPDRPTDGRAPRPRPVPAE